jgi:long-subunit acyl-CoA synthetase (AMP-forming)
MVMKGYRNAPKANEEVFFTMNGKRFFRTGDLGRMVEGRFLKITGRIKEQFKLENGKFVVPAPLEDIYSRGPFIYQCFLYGLNKPYCILLIIPNYVEWITWAQRKGKKEILSLLPTGIKDMMSGGNQLGKNEEENLKLKLLFQNPVFIEKINREVSLITLFH